MKYYTRALNQYDIPVYLLCFKVDMGSKENSAEVIAQFRMSFEADMDICTELGANVDMTPHLFCRRSKQRYPTIHSCMATQSENQPVQLTMVN